MSMALGAFRYQGADERSGIPWRFVTGNGFKRLGDTLRYLR